MLKKICFVSIVILLNCSSSTVDKSNNKIPILPKTTQTHQTIVFGSCNKHLLPQNHWEIIAQQNPDLWIWLGDVVYADANNEKDLQNAYHTLLKDKFYQKFIAEIPVTGIWDDHDFGLNDGGKHFEFKHQSAKLFLNFLNDSSDARNREGIYRNFTLGAEKSKSIELVLLDTRFFKDNPDKNKSNLQILGNQQWVWLQETLQKSESPLVIICSGIQVLSNQHPYESWG